MITTHSLFALKVQRKVSNGVADLATAGSSLDRQKLRSEGLNMAEAFGNLAFLSLFAMPFAACQIHPRGCGAR